MLESGSTVGAGHLAGGDHVAVLAGQAHRLAALGADPADDLLVDGAGEHHLDHLDGGRIRDAKPALELGLDAELLEHLADLRPAAMHDDGLDARLLEQHHVLGEILGRRPVAHGMAAILDHHHLLVVALHVRQRLHKHLGLHVNVGERAWTDRT